jgi:hypothetical protein
MAKRKYEEQFHACPLVETPALASRHIPGVSSANLTLPDYGGVARDSLKISGSAPELAFGRWGTRFGCFSERVL